MGDGSKKSQTLPEKRLRKAFLDANPGFSNCQVKYYSFKFQS
jgi:hypothetical protein